MTVTGSPVWESKEARVPVGGRVVLFPALATLALAAVVTAFAGLLAPDALGSGDLLERLQPPSRDHWFGTDDLGRDVLSQTLYAMRTSVLIAATAALMSGVIGATLGALAGWCGGRVDLVVSFLVDLQASLPAFILALGAIAFYGESLITLVVVLALEGWERFARIARAQVMVARTSGYAVAATNLGVSPKTVLIRHVLPALTGPLAAQFTLALPAKIILESSLSFLGLGVQSPQASLGKMIGDGRDYLGTAWWISLYPGLGIVLISVAVSFVGDYLQDRMVDRV